MAFNWKTFRTRTLTAIIFAAVMLTGLLWNYWGFVILFLIIHFGCWWEFVKLIKKIYDKKYLKYIFLGLIYITTPILLMIDLGTELRIYTINNTNEIIYHKLIPCSIIFSIWINDTMAYIVGSLIGKRPLSKISPKKTWEGTLGGMILATLVAGIIAWQFDLDIQKMTIIAAISSVAGTFGDLLESKLKRMARVKDSGNIMPGHGGFLDRFDSLLLAIPTVWLYVFLFMK
ncbi:MAG TPA: phosphatidate cytidylyltransferase [Chitinophagaceae bacterium]|nr:phosphatidate cytidylyltransferase [Chitinophagaceae bacterium]